MTSHRNRRRRERPRATRQARREQRRAFACVLLAFALLLMQSARIADVLLVDHALCAHGELVHETHRREPAVRISTAAAKEAHVDRSAAVAHTSHEHCDARSVNHRPGSVCPLLAGARLLRIDRAFVGQRSELRAIAQLELAPKASPPRA